MTTTLPRMMIAGTGGDAGKTVLCLALLSAWRAEERPLRVFKKGPDFIDAAWLGWAAACPGRNLDTFMMGNDAVVRSFAAHATREGLNLIEGNRGLLDGLDAAGTHSSASLASVLRIPVILVLSPVKMTATAAAVVLGCRQLAPDVELAGVILNQVSGARHERVVRQAIEEHTGVSVLGVLPKLADTPLRSRHLGLVPPAEHGPAESLRADLAQLARDHIDLESLRRIAAAAAPLAAVAPVPSATAGGAIEATESAPLRIGIFRDSAFTFYYPENLEALHRGGAQIVPISALDDEMLPDLDALYIGGGFPETHAEQLAANGALLADLRRAAGAGLPIYAECGGLMVLAESLEWQGKTVPMAGVLPVRVRMHEKPQGHGYCQMKVDQPNPFLPVGTELRGHEFHYSQITPESRHTPAAGSSQAVSGLHAAFSIQKGTGCSDNRDGLVVGNTLASYLHLHALATPAWATGLIEAARAHRRRRNDDSSAAAGPQRHAGGAC